MDRTRPEERARRAPRRFADFVRERKGEVLREWEAAVRRLPEAAELDRPALIDHVPGIVDEIAEIADARLAGARSQPRPRLAEAHALERLHAGFDLAQIVAELGVLRDCILRLWADEARSRSVDTDALHALQHAIDGAVAASIACHSQVLLRAEQDRRRLLEQAQHDRAEAERELAVNEALLSSSFLGVGFLDTELRYVRINEALAAMNGASVADHLGRSVRDILGPQAGAIEPLLHRIVATGEPVANLELTVELAATPAQLRSFLANYFPVRTPSGETLGVGATVLEITDRARAQDALRESEQRLKRALSIETVGVLFFRLDGRMLEVNPALERMSGYRRDELLELDWHTLTPPEFLGVTMRAVDDILRTGETAPYEKQWIRPDGSRWWGLFAPTRLSGTGRESECVEFIIDITQRKKAEEQLQAAMRAREEILAVVSHDLKNPLAGIYMAANVLALKASPDPAVRKQVELIQRAASRMDHLIGDLVDMASIQGGRLAVERKEVDPEALVMEAVEIHEPAAKEKGVRLVTTCDLRRRQVCCDRDRVLQVFGNLLGNAIKFCRSGDTIRVSAELDERDARFVIADTGPGIPPSDLSRVFEPYWSGTGHRRKGTGLGLYISKGIVEAHGGRVWVESTGGEGTAFSFTLPLDVAGES